MFRIISGALEPRAMSVRFARVGFQTGVFLTIFVPSGCTVIIVLVYEVIYSIDSIKMSEMIAIPMNR